MLNFCHSPIQSFNQLHQFANFLLLKSHQNSNLSQTITNSKTMEFRFFTFPHTCFKSRSKGEGWGVGGGPVAVPESRWWPVGCGLAAVSVVAGDRWGRNRAVRERTSGVLGQGKEGRRPAMTDEGSDGCSGCSGRRPSTGRRLPSITGW